MYKLYYVLYVPILRVIHLYKYIIILILNIMKMILLYISINIVKKKKCMILWRWITKVFLLKDNIWNSLLAVLRKCNFSIVRI